jgi:hypothetical protein
MSSRCTPKHAEVAYIIPAGSNLMDWNHTKWVNFPEATSAYRTVKYQRGFAMTVIVVKSGALRGTYAPRGM